MRTATLLPAAALLLGVSATDVLAQLAASVPRIDIASANHAYLSSGEAGVIQEGNYLVFPYGHTQPTLRCAPLRTCVVQLEAGEALLSKIQGDSERFSIEETIGPARTSLVAIKPKSCNITTDLTLTTDRRIYQLMVDVPACEGAEADQNPVLPYTPIVRFYYPDDFVVEYRRAEEERDRMAGERAAAAEELPEVRVGAGAGDLTTLNFAYRWQRDRRYPWVPDQIFDDGRRTHILLPTSARQHERPVLFALAPDGSMELVNYVVKGDFYVVDRVMDRAVLVVGGAKKGQERRLLIESGGSR